MRALDRLRRVPELEASSYPVGIARAGVGLAALVEWFEVAPELVSYAEPGLLKLHRFSGFPEIPHGMLIVFLAGWLVAASAFCVGLRTRPAGFALTLLVTYVLLLDHQLYSNHLYLMALLTGLLTLADSGAAFSLDSRLREARSVIPAWPVLLVRFQVTVVYAFAAATKVNLVYLSGLVLRTQLRIPGIESIPPPVFALAAVASVATEGFLAVALWKPRLRSYALAVGVGFHLTILAGLRVVPDLLTFGLLMVSGYLTFFSRVKAPTARRRLGTSLESAPAF